MSSFTQNMLVYAGQLNWAFNMANANQNCMMFQETFVLTQLPRWNRPGYFYGGENVLGDGMNIRQLINDCKECEKSLTFHQRSAVVNTQVACDQVSGFFNDPNLNSVDQMKAAAISRAKGIDLELVSVVVMQDVAMPIIGTDPIRISFSGNYDLNGLYMPTAQQTFLYGLTGGGGDVSIENAIIDRTDHLPAATRGVGIDTKRRNWWKGGLKGTIKALLKHGWDNRKTIGRYLGNHIPKVLPFLKAEHALAEP